MAQKRKSTNAKSSPRKSTRTSRRTTNKNLYMECNMDNSIIDTNNETQERLEATTTKTPSSSSREQCKRTTSLSSRLSRVIDKVKEDVKSTWDVHFTASPIITTLRDFAFPIHEGVVVFFATHKLLCKNVFGFDHGETLVIGRGLWSGNQATVVGVRNNMLWIVLAGDTFAQVLPTPSSSSSSVLSSYEPSTSLEEEEQQFGVDRKGKIMREYFCNYYKIKFVSNSEINNKVSRNSVEQDPNNKFTQSVAGKLISLLWKQRRSPLRVKNYSNVMPLSKTERDFLQNAPDLFVQLVSSKSNTNENDIARTGVIELSSSSEHARQKELKVHEVEDLYKHASRKHRSSSLEHSKMPESISDSASIASESMIVLSPCMLSGSKALGWSGEGSVVVPQSNYNGSNKITSCSSVNGDMPCVNASLSASIVML